MQRLSADNPRPDSSGNSRGWLSLTDVQLLDQCLIDVYRASGPGGQKRNKTSSAVRLRHQPTTLTVIAEESRSQHENKTRALRRLRQAIALHLRNEMGHENSPPEFYVRALADAPGLHLSKRHPDYWLTVQYVLDVLYSHEAAVADTVSVLRVSTGQLIRFLKGDPKLWDQANRFRRQFGHQPLR
ncbi:MAG: peptide chain release factor-like protein [Phycisphaerales bacterium]|nr:peptide chain release factor-like protein [Phycisphaerales bacterium]